MSFLILALYTGPVEPLLLSASCRIRKFTKHSPLSSGRYYKLLSNIFWKLTKAEIKCNPCTDTTIKISECFCKTFLRLFCQQTVKSSNIRITFLIEHLVEQEMLQQNGAPMVDCLPKGLDGLQRNTKFLGIKFYCETKRSSLHKVEER